MHIPRSWLAAITGLVIAAIFTLVVTVPWPLDGSSTPAAEAATSPESRRDGPLRVMPLGDSTTEGNGEQVPGGYRPYLWQLAQQENAAIDFVGSQVSGPAGLPDRDHEGYPGLQIQEIEQKAALTVPQYRPDVILLHIGTNNIWRPEEMPDVAPQRLARLIEHLTTLAPLAHLYVASIVPSVQHESNVRSFNETIPSIVADSAARGNNVSFVDQYSGLSFDDLIDGIHPNAGGYEKMAERWWEALRSGE